MFRNVYIVDAKRTPVGKFAGGLSSVRVDDLLAQTLSYYKDNATFPLEEIDDVIVGCANQAGEDNRNIARMSSLLADFPFEVPGTTVNRLCGSSLEALIQAACRIEIGQSDCLIVGGVEGMSRAPYVTSKAQKAFDLKQETYDSSLGWRFPNPEMEKRFPLFSMGETAEEVVQKLGISRQAQDKFALASHQKAIKAQEQGLFQNEILPISFEVRKKGLVTIDQDESPRKETSLEKLEKLSPVFRKDGTVTAGNSSPLNDGACALLVVGEEFLRRHNLTPIAKITAGDARGLHPNIMGLGPVVATNRLLQKSSQKLKDFDLIELNEAFAAQSLGCIGELELDPKIVNPRGGAIALGHPLGCSGGRIATTALWQMHDDKKIRKALLTMCIGVGQGIAVSLESCK